MAKKSEEREEMLPAVVGDVEYAVFKKPKQELRDIVEINLGGRKVRPFDLDRIKVPGGGNSFWTVPSLEGDKAVDVLEGIIILNNPQRAYWEDPNPTGKPPNCRSNDCKVGRGIRWEGDSEGPHACMDCKFSDFGWKKERDRYIQTNDGTGGQACKETQAFFFLEPETFLPTVVFFPPTSLKSATAFTLRMTKFGAPLWAYVVGFHLAPDKNADGQEFNRVEIRVIKDKELNAAQRDFIKSYGESLRPHLETVEVSADDLQDGGG